MSEVTGEQRSMEQQAARAVGAVPGVLRVEPTLAHAISRLSRARADDGPADADDRADGVTVTRRDGVVEVTVEISVVGPGSALDTALAVRAVLQKELTGASLTTPAVRVRVLAVSPEGTEQTSESQGQGDHENHEPAG